MSRLRRDRVCKQGHSQDEDAWYPQAAKMQVLRPQVHAQASETGGRQFSLGIERPRLSRMLQQTQNMIQLAFSMADAVERFRDRARQFFYQVMLSGHACLKCGGRLVMIREGQCRCQACENDMDPTIVFQRAGAPGTSAPGRAVSID